MKLKLGYQELITQAMTQIETLPLEQAKKLLNDENVIFVDIRDVRELEREGMIPNAFHAPRGMLEFWVDPDALITSQFLVKESAWCCIAPQLGALLWQLRPSKKWVFPVFVI